MPFAPTIVSSSSLPRQARSFVLGQAGAITEKHDSGRSKRRSGLTADSRVRRLTAAVVNPAPAGSRGLNQGDFAPLAIRGFGDPWNAYVHSMAWFEGRLYCGTFRANNCLLMRRRIGRPSFDPCPIRCPSGDLYEALDLRAQVWRHDPESATWDLVLLSPVVKGKGGNQVPREIGYRGMAVFQGKSDRKPALYVAPFSPTISAGPVILRSEDGIDFQPTSEAGLGYDGVSSFRALVSFNGRLYTSPIGMTQNIANASRYPIVFESEDPACGQWRRVSEPGFGDPYNAVVFNLAVLNDCLYAGTLNPVTGFQLWKTKAEGPAPYPWRKVLEFGAYRAKFSEGVSALCSFGDALYVGASIQDGGYDRINRIGPAGAELIRVYPDDSWELVVGTPRLTPDGLKTPTSGRRSGFDDIFNGYIWRMCAHEDNLYVGTFNWAVYLRYVDRKRWPSHVRALIEEWGIERLIDCNGGFDLWRTGDGNDFTPVTLSGFGSPFNCGVRNLVSTPIGLAVGAVNPFGPEVAVQRNGEWNYEENPRGGAEVWLGSTSLPAKMMAAPVHGAGQRQRKSRAEYCLEDIASGGDGRISNNSDPTLPGVRLEFGYAQLRSSASRIDQASFFSEAIPRAVGLFDLESSGTENIPQAGAVLLLGNNPAVPLFSEGIFLAAHVVYTLHAIAQRRGGPARLLASPRYFEVAERSHLMVRLLDRLGFVPATEGNGTRLLELGEAVLGYPEEQPSRPPYEMHEFASHYVQMALSTGAVIVPVAFIGTHESHLLIQRGDEQILVNKQHPLEAKYRIKFLPAVRISEDAAKDQGEGTAETLARKVRAQIEAVIRMEMQDRPLASVARSLQESRDRSGLSVGARHGGRKKR